MKNIWTTGLQFSQFFLFDTGGIPSAQTPFLKTFLICRPLKFLTATVLALLISSPVHAIPVFGSFQGTVTSSYDRVGNLFATDQRGQTVQGTFSYDTDLAPSGLVSFSGTVEAYFDPDYSLDWIDVSLNVSGLDLQVQSSGFPDENLSDRIIVENDRVTTNSERDGMQLISSRVYETYDYTRVYRNALVLGFGGEENQLFSDTELPTELVWNGSGLGSGSWSLYSAVESEILYGASLGFGLTSVTLTAQSSAAPVPEPSTILLLSTGLLGFAWYGRKRMKA